MQQGNSNDPHSIGRRDFLRKVGAGAAAVGATLAATGRARAQVSPSERINLGFIGVGGRGSHLARDLSDRAKEQPINIVGVCDVWDARTQAVADYVKQNNGVTPECFRDYRDLLQMPHLDAVVIATPDHWHAKQSIEAMEAGLDVYCEKPVTLYWDEAKAVAQVADKCETVFQCGAGSASDGRWWTAGDIVAAGGIGDLIWTQGGAFRNDPGGDWNWGIQPCDPKVDLDWDLWLGHKWGLAPKIKYDPERYSRFRKYWDYSGGLATDLLYHVLSHLIMGITPQFPYRVVASGGQPVHNLVNDNREVPTLFHMLVDYPSQHTVHLVGSQENETGVEEIIRGQKANITVGGPGVIVRPEAPFVDEMMELAKSLSVYSDAEVITEERDGRTVLREIQVPNTHHFGDHVQNWLECIRTREQPSLNAWRAYVVQVPIALAAMAYRRGEAIYFDPSTERVVGKLPKV